MLFQLMPICEAVAKDELGVLLTGIGGDEWFFGHWSSILDELWRGRILSAARDFQTLERGIIPRKTMIKRLLSEASSRWRRTSAPKWLHPSRETFAHSLLERATPRFPFVRNRQLKMLRISHAGTQILPQEQLAASIGVELRSPLMDIDLVDFSFALPGRGLTMGIQHKRLLRDSNGPLLPLEISKRPTKTYFGSLLDRWSIPRTDETAGWQLVRRRIITTKFDENLDEKLESDRRKCANLAVAELIARRYAGHPGGSCEHGSK
jgi:asparagine synthase (glutamine-hydrolysing)